MALIKGIEKSALPAIKTRSRSDSSTSSVRSSKVPAVDLRERDHPENSIYTVSISASAVRLDAFERFSKNMPGDSTMDFVLIPRLSPEHKSIPQELAVEHDFPEVGRRKLILNSRSVPPSIKDITKNP